MLLDVEPEVEDVLCTFALKEKAIERMVNCCKRGCFNLDGLTRS